MQDPRRYDMPISALVDEGDGKVSEAYAASVTHQLHCLVSWRFFVFVFCSRKLLLGRC